MRFRRAKKQSSYHLPRAVQNDPGKRPAGAKADWSGVILERTTQRIAVLPARFIFMVRRVISARTARMKTVSKQPRAAFPWAITCCSRSPKAEPTGRRALRRSRDRDNHRASRVRVTKRMPFCFTPRGAPGMPDSRACITVNDEGFRRVMHVMNRHPKNTIPLIIR